MSQPSGWLTKKLFAVGLKAWAKGVRLKRLVRLAGTPKLGRVDHFTIPVHDLARAREFYCGLLGAAYLMTVDDETFKRFGRPPAPDGGEGSHHISVFMGCSTRIDLFYQSQGQGARTLGHPHYAFEVPPGQLLTWKRRLQSAGIPLEGPLQLGPPGQASLYFNDPFGNHLELATLGFTGEIETRPPDMERLVWTHPASEMLLTAAG
jgi:catechol 2,3-dioxygenase-like lactoylglutathione lyase family enzyme